MSEKSVSSDKHNLLYVKNLNIAFANSGTDGSDKPIVHDINFTIIKGKTTALIGASGSGKSTIALAIPSLLPSHVRISGDIVFSGKNLREISEKSLRQIRGSKISMVFQEPMAALNPLHTIKKQIAEAIRVHQTLTSAEVYEKSILLLEKMEIDNPKKRLEAYPHQLSGGQRQRVLMAFALANSPELLIADEPTTALDVTTQKKILDLLMRLQEETGMSILLITHDIGVVRHIAHDVCPIDKGTISEQTAVSELFSRPEWSVLARSSRASVEKNKETTQDWNAEKQKKSLLSVQDFSVNFRIAGKSTLRRREYFKAVHNVSFSLGFGETLGIVGESGSGKTTLGLAIMKLIPSSSGSVCFDGHQIQDVSQSELRRIRAGMQIIFQDPFGSLSPRMSVQQIIAEGLRVHNRISHEEQNHLILEVLKDVGLDGDVANRYPHEFSGGQRQRIAIARAIVLRPKLVVLDEPTSALDITVQNQILDLLINLQEKYRLSYIFVSHDMHVVRSMAHRIMVMRHGEVVEMGNAEDIFSAPQHDYTKLLIRSVLQ
jgi:microcin C transport system ATP-binding protein